MYHFSIQTFDGNKGGEAFTNSINSVYFSPQRGFFEEVIRLNLKKVRESYANKWSRLEQ